MAFPPKSRGFLYWTLLNKHLLPALSNQHNTGESDPETNMYQQPQFHWAEEPFTLPMGVGRLGLSEPVECQNYVMYHGTSRANIVSILRYGFFQSKRGLLGSGVYLSRDLKKASYYPNGHPDNDKVVFRVLVEVGRVITIDNKDHPRRKTWQDPRYGPVFDTAWIPPGCGLVREVDCVWDPNRITILDIIHPQPVPFGYGVIYGYGYPPGYTG
ncbi:uncharacterized protein LOC128379345 [Scomber scombrus]|uniref:Uncharacterized protein LOC128379345 n=1 Tax=Scomber scombrus TaxID=13677 RepID=A0AAV1QE43_SCOSC